MKLAMLGVVGLALVCSLGGCKSEQKTEASKQAPAAMSINKTCPIGGHKADGTTTVTYKGKTIGFCCEDCVTEFGKMTEAQKDEVLAKASTGK